MSYESDLALRLTPYVAGEQPKNVKLIKLNTNENPYPPSPKVAEAIAAIPADRLRLYPDMDATALCAATAKFEVDVDGLMQGCPIALANPNAPTGMLLSSAEVRRLAQHTKDNGAVLLVDEAYAAFSPENALPLLSEFDNVLITRTFSKSHALAGMRIGYAIGSPRLIAALKRIRDSFNSYPLDMLAQAAGEAAILDTEYTATTVSLVCEARDRCRAFLIAAGIPCLKSATNFLFVKADPVDAAPVQQKLREAGILVRHFKADRLKAWLRVTVGTTADMEVVTEKLLEYCKP